MEEENLQFQLREGVLLAWSWNKSTSLNHPNYRLKFITPGSLNHLNYRFNLTLGTSWDFVPMVGPPSPVEEVLQKIQPLTLYNYGLK
ncbi:hypothetical protein F2Q69_00028503 [Brassica cretica]|uniref:Uncharacterized protein n=1 Tax=Brassica cretica TaxID=69181 RepID=A0A8S9SAH6_BRACR|nr:hypothetical protein F2Q69_00028503 [Brassica cretica]